MYGVGEFITRKLLLALCSMAVLLVLGSCGEQTSTSEKTTASGQLVSGGGFQASGPTFLSLDELVKESDLVVVGTVTEVLPGEVDAAGTPEAQEHLNTVVRVEEVLKGAISSDVVTVKTLQLAYARPYMEWRQPGERVLLFLSPSRETPELYIIPSHSQSAYILRSSDIVATVDQRLSNRVASLSLPELRRAVGRATAE